MRVSRCLILYAPSPNLSLYETGNITRRPCSEHPTI